MAKRIIKDMQADARDITADRVELSEEVSAYFEVTVIKGAEDVILFNVIDYATGDGVSLDMPEVCKLLAWLQEREPDIWALALAQPEA
jgi:hypothetical protein